MEFLDTKQKISIKKTFAKNARITLKPSGEICVSVPFFYTQKNISELLRTHQEWINKHLQKITQNNLTITNILNEHLGEVLIFGVWEQISTNSIKTHLKKTLLEYLHITTREKSDEMELRYNKISIRENKSRLGSCSYENNLSFSLSLVCAPKDLIDYVIIHELAHIKHKNHSKSFWELVQKHCPEWKQKRALLKKNTKLYLALLDSL